MKKDASKKTENTAQKVGTFKRIYESRDKKLCLFEDENGHLSAVNAKRLA